MTMMSQMTFSIATIVAITAFFPSSQGRLFPAVAVSAFTPTSNWSRPNYDFKCLQRHPPTVSSSSSSSSCYWNGNTTRLSATGKGFGDKKSSSSSSSSSTISKSKSSSRSMDETAKITTSTTTTTTSTSNISTNYNNNNNNNNNTGSTMLQQLRSREAEKRDAELRKLRELRNTDALLAENSSAAAIPEIVAQRMGKRMVPFVGIPLFGSLLSFIGFWYLATYKDMEFQPAIVATTSFIFLAMGLLGITYSVLSTSWDEDREGSGFGADEFQKNIGNIKDGLSRTKENALLRERMAGLSEDEIQRAIDEQDRRDKVKNKNDAWMQ